MHRKQHGSLPNMEMPNGYGMQGGIGPVDISKGGYMGKITGEGKVEWKGTAAERHIRGTEAYFYAPKVNGNHIKLLLNLDGSLNTGISSVTAD